MPPNLLSLPRELRLEILSYFIPYHTIIAISPIRFGRTDPMRLKPYNDSYHKSHQHIAVSCDDFDFPTVPPKRRGGIFRSRARRKLRLEKPAFHVDDAVFLINRDLSSEAYSMLYGSNIFRFEILEAGNVQPSRFREPHRLEGQGGKSNCGFVDWSRVPATRAVYMRRGENTSDIMGLSPATLAHIERMEILFFPEPIPRTGYGNFSILRSISQHMTDLLNSVHIERKLRDLSICVGHRHGERSRYGFLTSINQVDCGLRTRSTGASAADRTVHSAEDTAHQYFLEPFAAIHGVKFVIIAGCVTSGFASELAATMMRPAASGEVPHIELQKRAYRIGKKSWKNLRGLRSLSVDAECRFFYEPLYEWSHLAKEWPDDRFQEKRTCVVHKEGGKVCECCKWYTIRGFNERIQDPWPQTV